MVRLPEHRIGHIAMKNAMQDTSNQFTKKVRATFKEIFDYVPGDLTSPMQGKYAFKAAIKGMQWEKQQNAWRQHAQDHKNDGTEMLAHMPHPSLNGFLTYKKHGDYSDKEVSVLLNLRMHSHVLASVTGAHQSPVVPLSHRLCPHDCCRPAGKVEDEVHFVLNCPKYEESRRLMLEELTAIYPNFKKQWNVANYTQKFRRLIWDIPDDRAPLWPIRGTDRSKARVKATRAILQYLGSSAKKHPDMRDQLYNKAPNA